MNASPNRSRLSIVGQKPPTTPSGSLPAPAVSQVARASSTLAASHVSAHGRQGEEIVQDISLHVPPGLLVAIAGPDVPAQALLLAVLAGTRLPSGGQVQIDGINLFDYRQALAPRIGYVARQAGGLPALTVFEILMDAARLRVPRGTGQREQVEDALAAMDLQHQRDKAVATLSPSLRWRVCIAAELVANPSILVIDGPDEVLEPGAELTLQGLLRRLVRRSQTVIVAARSTGAIELSDRVVLLAPRGYLAWYGPPDEAIAYFKAFCASPVSPTDPFGFDDIAALLADPEAGTPQEWAERYRAQPAYKQYVEDPLFGKHRDLQLEERPLTRFRGKAEGAQPPPKIARPGALAQFAEYLARSLRVFVRDRRALALAFVLPLVLAALEYLLVSRQMYDPVAGDATQATISTALLAFMAMAVGAFSFVGEVIKERGLRPRERQLRLGSLPYVLAKVAIVVPVALYQALIWTGMFYAATGVPGGFATLGAFYATLAAVAFVGGLTGLLASALARTVQGAVAVALCLLVPQLLLSGGIVPLQKVSPAGRALAVAMPARYAFEALVTASHLGGDLVTDRCWALPPDQRAALTAAQMQGCRCLGSAAGLQCNFPGVRRFAALGSGEAPPVEPVPNSGISNVPVQPAAGPGETLDEYARAVNNYTLQLEIYHNSLSDYIQSLRGYGVALNTWGRENGLAAGSAEALLAANVDAYGPIYNVNLLQHGLILLVTALLLVALLAGIEMHRERSLA